MHPTTHTVHYYKGGESYFLTYQNNDINQSPAERASSSCARYNGYRVFSRYHSITQSIYLDKYFTTASIDGYYSDWQNETTKNNVWYHMSGGIISSSGKCQDIDYEGYIASKYECISGAASYIGPGDVSVRKGYYYSILSSYFYNLLGSTSIYYQITSSKLHNPGDPIIDPTTGAPSPSCI